MPSAFWAAFLGQQTQTMPAVARPVEERRQRFARSAYDVWKVSVTSTDLGSRRTTVAAPVSSSRSSGAPSRRTTCSSLMPIFVASGVPE